MAADRERDNRQLLNETTENLLEAGEELPAGEQRFRAIFESYEDCIFIKDRDLKYADVNSAVYKLFGTSPEIVIGKTDLQLFGETARPVVEIDRRVLAGEVVENEEHVSIKGAMTTFMIRRQPLRDASGNIIGLYGIARDITEQKRAEEAVKQSQQMLNRILSASPLGISYVEQGKLKWTNQAMVEIFGYERGVDYLDKGLKAFYASEKEYKRVVKVFLESIAGGKPTEVEAQFKRKDGSVFFGFLRISALDPIQPRAGTIATISDISARKWAEEKLRESEERYRLLTQNSLTGIYIHQAGLLVFANDRLAGMLGYTPDEMVGRLFWEFVHPLDREMVKERGLSRYLDTDVPAQYQFRALCNDGSTKWVELLASFIKYRGRPANMGNVADITERKQAEEALRESEEHYRTLVEDSFDGIFVQRGSKIVFANRRVHEMLGYAEGDLEGLDHWLVYHRDYQELARSRSEARMRGEKVPSRYEIRLQRKDGSSFDGEIRARAVKFGEEAGVQVWTRDITERKRAQKESLRVEKLESIGILAGGIAHDFNNILTAIMGNISLARLRSKPGDKVSERLALAEKACQRAQGLTQQLLTFSKGGAPIKKALLISEIVKDCCEFSLRGSNVGCEFSFSDDLWTVEVDVGQLSQVINNLVINADQAMPHGGLLRVAAENVTVNADQGLPIQDGKYVRISFEDQGIGIPEEHITKIFDPYFTTKDMGSGLGLATVHSIIKNHHGLISVESKPDNGTSFHIYLPASRKITKAEGDSRTKPVQGKGKILVMDDEEAIRDIAVEILSTLGYEVHTVKDGSEAVELYQSARNDGRPFDAVIMDLTIPGGVGGKEAVEKLRDIDPAVKAVASSGYSNDPVMARYGNHGFDAVLPKPYRADELGQVLEKLLEGKG